MFDLILLHISVFANFAAFAVITLIPKNRIAPFAPKIAVSLSGVGALASTILLVIRIPETEPLLWNFTWLKWGSVEIGMGYYLDQLSLIMLTSVCLISFVIQLYSTWYMNEDPAKRRFFGTITFFSWAMIFFVVSSNLLGSYIFWEFLGLASYLLIGFWYEKPEPRRAAIKAFIMTRFGDIGFLAAVIFLLIKLQNLEISFLISQGPVLLSPSEITLIVVLLFLAVMGKSAQFPLHTWLPDAMEGPTPVSALIHSATMVAAGVYMLVRLFPLISVSEAGMTYMLWVGAFTSLLAAFLALTQRDMKRILAYSTVSQLGFMVMIIGAGSWQGGMFHLLTHAFFKSMLFLLSGYFIFAAHHSNDIFDMGNVPAAQKSKLMLGLLWIGSLALSGLFPFSGFMSKESIFSFLMDSGRYDVYAVALAVTFLTAYYTSRMAFVVSRSPESGAAHHEELPKQDPKLLLALKIPVVFLGVVTVLGAWVFLPWLTGFFGLHENWYMKEWLNFVITTVTVLSAIGIAYLYFGAGRVSVDGLAALVPGLRTLIAQRFYVDHFWGWMMKNLVYRIAKAGFWSEAHIINACVNRVGLSVVAGGKLMTRLQYGQVQRYLVMGVLVIVGVVAYFSFK